MKYVADTNVLLELPASLNKYNLVITSMVLRELEKHILSHNQDLAYKARRAVRYIREKESELEFDVYDYAVSLGDGYNPDYVDNQILQCCIQRKLGLITNDILLCLKAKSFGVEVISLEDTYDDLYKGYKKVCLNHNDMADFYQDLNQNHFDLFINQYLIIQDETNNCNTVDIFRWTGDTHASLRQPPKRVINPLNDLQRCAIDLLYNKQIPIKVITGTHGSGKTMLSVKMGLWHVKEKGNYSKIMMVRNPIGAGEEIGFLPGDKEEKMHDFFKPIIQHLDRGEFDAMEMRQKGELDGEVPFYMKGLSIGGAYIIVDEAEDLDIKTLKLLGTRPEESSCIVFSGDYKQAENKYMKNNGLIKMIQQLKGNPLVGIINLDTDVRSEASKVFTDLE